MTPPLGFDEKIGETCSKLDSSMFSSRLGAMTQPGRGRGIGSKLVVSIRGPIGCVTVPHASRSPFTMIPPVSSEKTKGDLFHFDPKYYMQYGIQLFVRRRRSEARVDQSPYIVESPYPPPLPQAPTAKLGRPIASEKVFFAPPRTVPYRIPPPPFLKSTLRCMLHTVYTIERSRARTTVMYMKRVVTLRNCRRGRGGGSEPRRHVLRAGRPATKIAQQMLSVPIPW